eukprot:6304417-Alexandrium_andersonii.AAC.1
MVRAGNGPTLGDFPDARSVTAEVANFSTVSDRMTSAARDVLSGQGVPSGTVGSRSGEGDGL